MEELEPNKFISEKPCARVMLKRLVKKVKDLVYSLLRIDPHVNSAAALLLYRKAGLKVSGIQPGVKANPLTTT